MTVLHDVVRKVLDETTSSDERVIAKEVISTIRRVDQAEAFEDAVIEVLRKERVVSRGKADQLVRRGADDNASPRWESAAGLYSKWLMQHETIDGVLKRRGDLTADEVLVCIENRRQTVAGAIRTMESFKALHAEMVKRKVKVLADLPQDVLMGVIQ